MYAVPSLRHLEMFQLLMRTHNLTTTARLMGVSQPAVSLALKEVENQTGFRLFNRNSRRIEPTTEAIALQPEIERLFGEIGSLTRKISDLRNPGGGSINVASVLSLTAAVLPRAAAGFHRDHPHVHVGLYIHRYVDVIAQVREGTADMGFIYSAGGEYAEAQHTMMAEKLIETQLVCIFRASDPLAEKRRITLKDLEGRGLIVVSSQTVPGLLLRRRLVERRGSVDVLDINNAFTAVNLAREGLGVGLADPLLLSAYCGAGMVGRPFDPPVALTMTMLTSRGDNRCKAAAGFVHHVKAAAVEEVKKLTDLGINAQICS